ncbi:MULTISPECIES: outer membrane protein assembly factor BamE domain-containing protein [Flammeovirga]|uniref:Outer membrane protein assembly factor BamE n=1 Tax=Flammeovirga agarivorans TaxID=2726742 RepID=A0A7X8XV71_9BACT|nr:MULTISPECIES: outer membrane protein assembly factor BamE [Flammeovirga]NLR91038.1 outer membrane protein assembly factor BamE [Flammeovirga agarivorans]
MKYLKQITFLGLIACNSLMFSCAKPSGITQDEFDMKTWKNDPNACHGDREKLEKDFISVKDKLLGSGISEVRSVLGKPDRVDLDKRSTKQYVYYVTSGSQCGSTGNVEGKRYKIYFDALETVREVAPIL